MRYLTFIASLFIIHFSWTQSIYGSISGGYQYIDQNSQPPSYIVNSFHQISYSWFWREEDFSFTDAANLDLSFGHMLNENIGYELTGAYLKPFDLNDEDEYLKRNFSGQFLRMSARFILSVPLKNIELYSKVGLNYTVGKLNYYQVFHSNGLSYLDFEEARMEYEYTDGSSLGFNFSIGANINVNRRFSIFAEIYSIYETFEPSKGRMTKVGTDEDDELKYYEPYFSQIEFGDESENSYYYSYDKTKPQKQYKRSYSLSGIGINVGVKFTIWRKKVGKDDNG